jgi:hypothetical protein
LGFGSPMGDTLLVYETVVAEGQIIEAGIFSKTGQNGYKKTLRAIWENDTIFNETEIERVEMKITL